MDLEAALDRLSRLPAPLPPPPATLEPAVIVERSPPSWMMRAMTLPARDAAALVLLYPGASGEATVLLTVRPADDIAHPGQVALPGGKREPADTFPVGTALREAQEEVGLDAAAEGVRTIGLLETVDVRVSGFLLVPVLAVAAHEPRFRADRREVAMLLPAPVRHFLPEAPIELVEEDRDGLRLRYGAFLVEGQRVWGATARVLGQLGAILGGPTVP